MYAAEMTSIAEVGERIRKVEGLLEGLRKRLEEDMPTEEKKYLWEEKTYLLKEKDLMLQMQLLLMQSGHHNSIVQQIGQRNPSSVDRSEEWIKHMLIPELTKLPQNDYDLETVLFPEKHGKLPVSRRLYLDKLQQKPELTKRFLIEADDSVVPHLLASALRVSIGHAVSEMNISARIQVFLMDLFEMFTSYSPHTFEHQFLINCNERTGASCSGSTRERSRPDVILTASGCTFLVGEDKLSSLDAAEDDLRAKVRSLPTMFYGELQFILGYTTAGSLFQWVFIGKSGLIRRAGRSLNLSTEYGRYQFLLSIGYAYQLIKKMVELVPVVPGRRAMFTEEVERDRTLYFYHDRVQKSIKNFNRFCEEFRTRLDVILQAYEAGERCPSLPHLKGEKWNKDYINRRGTYKVEISPLGHSPILRSERDIRMMAKNVCKALFVLHDTGLVHRDVRLPNIVQISEEQFMLIDLETVAVSPFRVPDGFKDFKGWSIQMLEGSLYTPMSDMYQLGRLLEQDVHWMTESTEFAQQFIRKLKSKQFTAANALSDPWLSDPIP